MTTNPYLDERILCCSFALWRTAPHTPQTEYTSTPNGLCNNTNGNKHSCCKLCLMRLYDQTLQFQWKCLHSHVIVAWEYADITISCKTV